MSMTQIIFSPTGGTAKAARILAEAFHQPLRTIDLTDADADFSAVSIDADDLCIIAVPAYGGRMPAAAAQRLALMQGSGAKAVLMAVYGNRAFDDTLLEMHDVAAAAGFIPIAGVGAVAEHSLARQYGAQRPDSTDETELAGFARQIAEKLTQPHQPLSLPGSRPYKAFGGVPAKPLPADDCGGCGLCARHCPVHAIDPAAPALTNAALCISCMRCVSLCPRHARQIDPALAQGLAQKLSAACAVRKENQLFL